MKPEDYVAGAPWRFAKTMPHMPHEYTVRGETPDDAFEDFVTYIRQHGYEAEFETKTYTYLNIGEWRYWTMGSRVEETTIINRARISDSLSGNLKQDEGAYSRD